MLSAYYLFNKLTKATDKVGFSLVTAELKANCKQIRDVGYKSIFYDVNKDFDLKYKDKDLFIYSWFGLGSYIQVVLSFNDGKNIIKIRISLEQFLEQQNLTYDEFVDFFKIKKINSVLDNLLNNGIGKIIKLSKRS